MQVIAELAFGEFVFVRPRLLFFADRELDAFVFRDDLHVSAVVFKEEIQVHEVVVHRVIPYLNICPGHHVL